MKYYTIFFFRLEKYDLFFLGLFNYIYKNLVSRRGESSKDRIIKRMI